MDPASERPAQTPRSPFMRCFWLAARRFQTDQCGSYLVISGLLMPVLVGIVGLGTEAGLWYARHKKMQSATDSAALSAATDYYLNHKADTLTLQAQSVAASYGFVADTNGVGSPVQRLGRGTYLTSK